MGERGVVAGSRAGAASGAVLLVLLLAVPLTFRGGSSGYGGAGSRFQGAVVSADGAVASASPDASAVGVGVLAAGGNAVDAAAATVFAVGVVAQESCGIGGGGFLLYRGADGTAAALDFRETAPAGLPLDFESAARRFRGTGHQVVGVPGTVAGMAAALQRFGTRSFAELLDPAVGLARTGPPAQLVPDPGLEGRTGTAGGLRRSPASVPGRR